MINPAVIKEAFSRKELENIAEQEALLQDVDPNLVKAIISRESSWRPNAVSKTGNVGLMQLGTLAALETGVKNRYDPKENIRGGISYLKRMLSRLGGDETEALAAYHLGPTRVARSKMWSRRAKNYISEVQSEARLRAFGEKAFGFSKWERVRGA